jgi:antitoxin VapB
MPLNIKDEAIHFKAKQLAAITGESLTSVVRQALDERMATVLRQKQSSAKAGSAAKLMELARLCAAQMPAGLHSCDHADLYDQNGMPL